MLGMDVIPIHHHLAGSGIDQSADQFDQRTFAGAVGADQPHNFPGIHAE